MILLELAYKMVDKFPSSHIIKTNYMDKKLIFLLLFLSLVLFSKPLCFAQPNARQEISSQERTRQLQEEALRKKIEKETPEI